MKQDYGLGCCGLACCLCGRNDVCPGCSADGCAGSSWCETRKCALERGHSGCYACGEDCHKGMLGKPKPYGFTAFAKRYGPEELLACLARNERAGIVYHRDGIVGDYDGFDDVETLIALIKTGKADT